MLRHSAKYRVQCPDSKRVVCRYRYAVIGELGRFQDDMASPPDAHGHIASACKVHRMGAHQICRAGVSRDRQDFISNEVQPDAGWRSSVEIERIHRFEHVPAMFVPGISLGEDAFCQTWAQ